MRDLKRLRVRRRWMWPATWFALRVAVFAALLTALVRELPAP